MLSKKVNAKLKRAYYYFGFEQIVPYDDVKEHMDILKAASENDEELSLKVDEYMAEIEEFVNTADYEDEAQEFAKDEPRKSWESYKSDFPEDVFENSDAIETGDIEPVEEDVEETSIEAAGEDVEEDVEETSIEPAEDEEGSLEPVEEDVEDIEETDIEPVEEIVEIEGPEEEIDDWDWDEFVDV